MCVFLLGMVCKVMSQAVGIGTNNPHSSSLLEINSNNKGLLLPRVTDTNSVSNPAKGLAIYNTTDNKTWFFNGSRWQQVMSNAGGMDSIWYKKNDSVVYTKMKFVGVNADLSVMPQQATMQIAGSISVQEPQVFAKAAPRQNQTYTMPTGSGVQFIPVEDSVFRLFDPGGTANYGPGILSSTNASGAEKAGQIGWKLSINKNDFEFAAGDTLWLTQYAFPECRTRYMTYFTAGSEPATDLIFSEDGFLFIFKSDNAAQSKGFDITGVRIFQAIRSPNYIPNTVNAAGSAMYLSKGSFAAGFNSNAKGYRSLALGQVSTALGNLSVAIGSYNYARGGDSYSIGKSNNSVGENSFALGFNNESYGYESIALGSESVTRGSFSYTLGFRLTARAAGAVSVGIANDTSDKVSEFESQSDRIFQVGNGSFTFRRNAMTVLRNGNIGIGMTTPNAQLQLANTVANRKLVLFENANDNLEYFGFGINDYALRYNVTSGSSHIFYCTSTPVFTINNVGNALLRGTLTQNSDARLKTNITRIDASLAKISRLNGYHYNWIDTTRSSDLQIGLLAQEVQALFPELVEEDKEGNLSVNYIGLTPVLIESIKELNHKIENQQKQIDELIKRMPGKSVPHESSRRRSKNINL